MKSSTPLLSIPLTIKRNEEDFEVEIRVLDFYLRHPPRFFPKNYYSDDDPNEVQLAPEGIIPKSGEKIPLTQKELSLAEEKFWKTLLEPV